MGVYINMEVPKNGSCIQIVIDDDGKAYPSVEKCILKMGSIAKAVPVPEHGRLGDLDELYASLEKWLIQNRHSMTEATRVWVRGVLEGIAAAPTIIPAEPPREET